MHTMARWRIIRRLSRALHGRGMYLIQDIVVNHTGNFFGYDGPYDAKDTAKNFVLYEGTNRSPTAQTYCSRHLTKSTA